MEYICKSERLSVLPDKAAVLRNMGCTEDGALYNSIAAEFDKQYERICTSLDVRCTITAETECIFVMLTAGEGISRLSEELFSSGEGLAGLIANACADDVIFSADAVAAERIKYYCAKKGVGVQKRLAAPEDMPLTEQAVILEKAPLDGVCITDAFMLNPAKTMGYKLMLTENQSVFKAQHDCSVCPNLSCPRRSSAEGSMDIISDFDYVPHSADGVAVDIGTTTVAVMRLENGAVKARVNEINAQRRFGADVLSRIEAAGRGRGAELKSVIEYQLKTMIHAAGGDGLPTLIAANTTMACLYMGLDCTSMGSYPFKAPCLDTVKNGNITVIGGISSFVGGDITSGLYMCGFDESEDVNLFIDLGTNGEMAIGNRHRILCTSTAAGPAFEGGRISCGTGSVDGAVCAVDLKNNTVDTIGAKKPCGICGTGIVELAAELIDNGFCDNTGRFKNGLEFKVAEGVIFTQKDMRELQTAKAAVRAGIELLISEYGADEGRIKNVYIAGGFGKRLNINKACRIGLLPGRMADKCRAAGNSSLGGAVKLLERPEGFDAIERIKAAACEFSLAQNCKFNDMFMQYMNFEED